MATVFSLDNDGGGLFQIDATSGVISRKGALTVGSSYGVAVRITDTATGRYTGFTDTITATANALALSGTPNQATVGTAYSFTPTVSYQSGAVTYGFTGTLPNGCSFSTATGTISGTPTTAATTTGTISATDAGGNQASLAISITAISGFVAGTPLYFVGDSLTSETFIPLGYSTQLQGKMAGKYVVPPLGNRGSSGAYAADANREASIQSHFGPPGIAIVMLGTNTDPAGYSVTTAAIRAIYDRLLAAGHKVIAMTPPNTSASRQDTAFVLAQTDVTVVPLHSIITASDLYDGTHFNEGGVNKVLGQLVPMLNSLSAVPNNTAYTAGGTNLTHEFTASGGTVNGTGLTGTAPANWEVTQTTGNATSTVNMVVEDGFPTMEITVTGGTQYTEIRLTDFIPRPGSTVSDVYDAWFEFKIVSGAVAQYLHTHGANSLGGTPNAPYSTLSGYQTLLQWVKPFGNTGGNYNQLYIGCPANVNSVYRVRRPRVIQRSVANFYPRPYTASGNRPTVSGTAKVGQTLTVNPQTWYAVTMPVTLTYQWYSAGTAVSGSTATTYVPVSGDIGKAITCTITATNAAGMAETFTPAPTAAVVA